MVDFFFYIFKAKQNFGTLTDRVFDVEQGPLVQRSFIFTQLHRSSFGIFEIDNKLKCPLNQRRSLFAFIAPCWTTPYPHLTANVYLSISWWFEVLIIQMWRSIKLLISKQTLHSPLPGVLTPSAARLC